MIAHFSAIILSGERIQILIKDMSQMKKSRKRSLSCNLDDKPSKRRRLLTKCQHSLTQQDLSRESSFYSNVCDDQNNHNTQNLDLTEIEIETQQMTLFMIKHLYNKTQYLLMIMVILNQLILNIMFKVMQMLMNKAVILLMIYMMIMVKKI